MKYVCCQPAIDYYLWQVEVMINNFIQNGINPKDIHIICSTYVGEPHNKWLKMQEYFKDVNFTFYKDFRPRRVYISSIRPWLLNKYWTDHPELEKEIIFYHDCDMIFTKAVDFAHLEEGDICYVSDTVSYIGAKYIRSKGEHYLDMMTKIVGVDKEKVISEELNSGGAQYIMKGLSANFWQKVYLDSEKLFGIITAQISKDKPDHSLQIWCADMWAVLWNLWVVGKDVKVTKDLEFAWATSSIDVWDKLPIYHNAGALATRPELFYKGGFQKKLPYDIDLNGYSDKWCSYRYAQEVLKTKEVTCLK